MNQPRQAEIGISLHPRQADALETIATEVLYGGASGGGKSFSMRVAAISWAAEIPGLQVYLFRRISDDLIKNHVEGPKGLRAMLAPWVLNGFAKIVDDEVRLWNGSKIYLCHCKDEKDIYKYQGAEIHLLLIDELTHWTESMYRFLRNRVRMVGINLPPKYVGRFPRIMCSANPGNIGHLFVKATFIDNAEPMQIRQMPANEGGMLRQFIPARLEDNPSMAEDDPGYEQRLQGLGSPELVAAMRHGDWNVVEGAYFPEFSTLKHVIRPCELPVHWTRARSFDWGSAKPFSVGWWAFATEDFQHTSGIVIPKAATIQYREWYGAASPNVGFKMTAEEVATGVLKREPEDEKVHYAVADPSIFAQDGGPSIAERMYNAGLKGRTAIWQAADNKRVGTLGHMGGWDLLRARLKGEGFGTADWKPMIYFFSTCHAIIRTLPAMQHDVHRPEDLDSDGEDHCFSKDTIVHTKEGDYTFSQMIGKTGFVRSHDGEWHQFRSARLVKRNAETIRLTFASGEKIECTPDHKFLTPQGWIQAQSLKGHMILSLSQKRFRNFAASDITSAGIISKEKGLGFIARFGRRFTDQFPQVIMYAMRTGIARITPSKIYSLWTNSRIYRIMASNVPTNLASALTKLDIWQKLGMVRQRAAHGIGSIFIKTAWAPLRGGTILNVFNATQPFGGAVTLDFAPIIANQRFVEHPKWITSQGTAFNATLYFKSTNTLNKSSVASDVLESRHVCVSLENLGPQDVYCLTVPETGNFALANGMIVANCADQTRYLCASRPWLSKAPMKLPIQGLETMTMEQVWTKGRPQKRADGRI